MQLSVEFELSDELGEKLLKRPNLQQFVQQAIEKMLLEETKLQAKQTLFMLMAKVPNSISLADELIKERRLSAKMEQQ